MNLERLKELTNEYLNAIRIYKDGYSFPLFESSDVNEFAIYDEYGDAIALTEFLEWLTLRFDMEER